MTMKKSKTRPFKKFYCDRDDIFLLPPLAFKLWMFYYKHENAKRESWLSRDTIVARCGLNKDAVTKWRKWLITNGWMQQTGIHQTPGHFFGVPIMRVTRGVIPDTSDGRGRSKASKATQFKRREVSATSCDGKYPPQHATGNIGGHVTGNIGSHVTGTSRAEVDINPEVELKSEVEGTSKSVSSVSSDKRPVISESGKPKVKTEIRNGRVIVLGGNR
jgi:Helix-turn-helix domain